MIRSMTAFASGERATPWGVLGCELRSVNHRFLETGLRLADELRALEPLRRERIAARIQRGKLDLVLRLRSPESRQALAVDEALLEQLGALAQRLDPRFPRLRVEFTELLQFPGVLQARGTEPEALQREALALLDRVLDEFTAAREREGGKLAAVIAERAEAIARIAGEVRALVPLIRAGQRQKRLRALHRHRSRLQNARHATIDSRIQTPDRTPS